MKNKKIYRRAFKSFIIIGMLAINGCFAYHPDTCEVSCCELSTPNKIISLDKAKPSAIIDVCACKSWNESGVTVKKGDKFIFQVKNIIEPWQDGVIQANPHDGWSEGGFLGALAFWKKRSLFMPWYALVGTVGGSGEQTFKPLDYFSEQEPFEVDIEQPQELYFYANDAFRRYFNNQGKLQLIITKINP